MKKRIALALTLVLILLGTASCAYLPMLESVLRSGAEPGAHTSEPAAPPAAGIGTGTVIITQAEYDRLKKFSELADMYETVAENYYQDADGSLMLDGAAAGMLAALDDPYTFYYTAEEYEKLWEDDGGEYAGIGIQITSDYSTHLCTISRVFKGGPAEAAGVKKGDILYQVEDLLVHAENVDEAVSIMRGTPDTPVTVTFLRGEKQMTYEIKRAKINVNRVSSTMLEDGIGYIYLYEFAGDCAKEFASAVGEITSAGGRGLIIDLRDNPGGWVNDAQSIADIFTDAGTLCYLQYKDGSRYYYKTNDGKTELALVILINGSSASSSEILTGCLKDRAGATVVGTQSYGKGIVQDIVPLNSGAGMQLTVAQYYTPNGNAVHKIGITPDVICELPEDDNGDYDFADLNDPQLTEALRVMREKLAGAPA